jgi:hypothetical protein
MILEAMKRIRALESRVKALEDQNAQLKLGHGAPADERPIDTSTKSSPTRKRGRA